MQKDSRKCKNYVKNTRKMQKICKKILENAKIYKNTRKCKKE